MKVNRFLLLFGSLSMLVALSACSDYRRVIGTEKSTPDEFQVVIRPPLSMPPEFSARPDQDAVDLIVDDKTSLNLMRKIFEQREVQSDNYNDFFQLSLIEDDVRQKVDEETAGIIFERRLPINVIFGGLPDVGPILDQIAEDRRLRTNRLQQKALNEGATPAFDGVFGDPVLVE